MLRATSCLTTIKLKIFRHANWFSKLFVNVHKSSPFELPTSILIQSESTAVVNVDRRINLSTSLNRAVQDLFWHKYHSYLLLTTNIDRLGCSLAKLFTMWRVRIVNRDMKNVELLDDQVDYAFSIQKWSVVCISVLPVTLVVGDNSLFTSDLVWLSITPSSRVIVADSLPHNSAEGPSSYGTRHFRWTCVEA